MGAPEPRLAAEIWVAAHLRQVEISGGAGFVTRRGADGAGAVLLKTVRLDRRPPEPCARALARATLGDGRLGWRWLVGPDWSEEREVDAALERQAGYDPDLWILEIEDRDGRHFLPDPPAD